MSGGDAGCSGGRSLRGAGRESRRARGQRCAAGAGDRAAVAADWAARERRGHSRAGAERPACCNALFCALPALPACLGEGLCCLHTAAQVQPTIVPQHKSHSTCHFATGARTTLLVLSSPSTASRPALPLYVTTQYGTLRVPGFSLSERLLVRSSRCCAATSARVRMRTAAGGAPHLYAALL